MRLCIDIGNSTIHFGVCNTEHECIYSFKVPTKKHSYDELGTLVISSFNQKNINICDIDTVGVSSVVPILNDVIDAMSTKYINLSPVFLKSESSCLIDLDTNGVVGIGIDRFAGCIAATHKYPDKNIVIVDCGTAVTTSFVNKNKTYISGTISIGVETAMRALKEKTALLPEIAIKKPSNILFNSTENHICAGMYYLYLGGIQKIIKQTTIELGWKADDFFTVCSGGNGKIFDFYNVYLEDLVLIGISIYISHNTKNLDSKEKNY